MGGLEIGISGIHAAQSALDIIGNNIANAATEGYHRQRPDLRPLDDVYTNGLLVGQGVEVKEVERLINKLLEEEIINKESSLKQIERELDTLVMLESSFGELSTSALSTTLDNFYNSLHRLSEEPVSTVYKSQVVSNAQTLSNLFHNIGHVINDVFNESFREAQNAVKDINELAEQIAEWNLNISNTISKGDDPNNLMDQRDRLLNDLGRLVGIDIERKERGVVDVIVGDIPLVVGTMANEVKSGLDYRNDKYYLGLSLETIENYDTSIEGGRIGGLVSLYNSIIPDIDDKLDKLTGNIITQTNKLHIQGVGSHGSFTKLDGWALTATTVDELEPAITAGENVYFRVTNIATGAVTRSSITVNAGDTLAAVAANISGIANLNASVASGKLEIVADGGFEFDFLPGVLQEPQNAVIASAAPPDIDVSGNYSGTDNEVYTCTVTSPGASTIGTGTITVEVRDSGANLITTLSLGSGYESASWVDIEKGIKIKFGSNGTNPGELTNGDTWDIEALADSDPAGLLTATGLNAFFVGTDANSIDVVDEVANDFSRIAISRTVEMTDNENVLRMAQLGDATQSDLEDMTTREYYRTLATNIGEQIGFKQLQEENVFGVWRSLSEQRDNVSGVDMNDEATKMMMFERMFKGMAKYMNTVQKSLNELMNLL